MTRLVNDVEVFLQSAQPNSEDLELLIERLVLEQGQLNTADATIEPLISEQDGDLKFTHVLEYSDKIVTYMTKLKSQLRCSAERGNSSNESNLIGSTNRSPAPTKSKIKLPKPELLKFNGQRKKWQPF